ncbi:MAG TPA: phosphatase PAP2 family protein, partial [Polyangiaceae bacterium]|nr:phosphatase PAP2 family protein [Polyangiaceae bacterium]
PLLGAARPAAAAQPRSHELEHVDARFLAFELGGSVVFSSVLLLAAPPTPTACKWCTSNGFDEAFRDLLRADDPRAPAGLSHALSMGAAPALALGALIPPALMTAGGREALENVVMAFDAVTVTFGITQFTKHVVARARPAEVHGVYPATEYANIEAQRFQSFFSGDTSLAFSLASTATTISFLRGYSVAPYVLGMGSVIAFGTAGLRIAADMHWATDVLTGAAVGTAVGFGMPYFLHARTGGATKGELMLVPRVGAGEAGVTAFGTF